MVSTEINNYISENTDITQEKHNDTIIEMGRKNPVL